MEAKFMNMICVARREMQVHPFVENLGTCKMYSNPEQNVVTEPWQCQWRSDENPSRQKKELHKHLKSSH